MRYILALSLSVGLCLATTNSHAQTVDSVTGKLANFPSRLFGKIQSQSTSLNAQLSRQTERYLARMAKSEGKLRARLYKQDSVKAAALYPQDPKQQYAALLQKFRQDSSRAATSMGPEYLARVDSLQGALAFLNKNPSVLNANPALQAKMQASLASVQQLQAKLQAADIIKQFVQSRKAQIQQALSGYTHLPSGISNAFAGYKQQAFYYSDQIKAYRAELNDPQKMMQTALVLLNKLPAFASFMQKNSFLAGIMGVPPGYGTPQGITGLQTREQIMGMIQSKMGSGSGGGGGSGGGIASLQNTLNSAKQDINKLHSKLSSLGGGSGGMDMPDFKPNDQHSKTFLKRLEYGVSLQTTQTTYYYPTTTNIGVTVAYKLGASNLVGVRGSYLIGWGNGFQHMALSSQGISFGSFLQIKIKSSFSLTGGLEYNYETPFSTFKAIRSLIAWTPSGLIGITKTISMKSTVFKKTQVSILWDLLSYYQVPRTQPFVFRLGYSL
jgi:hypothetical protein